MDREILFNLAKIVEGANAGDGEKVLAYSNHLCERLEAAGEKDAATRIRRVLAKKKGWQFTLAKMDGQINRQSPVPVDGESRLPTADVEHIKKEDVHLFLSSQNTKTLQQFLAFYRAADRLHANGVGVPASLLLYGPPGNGKTLFAKSVAAELSLPLLTARTDSLISSYLGSTAKNIRLLFEHASSRPCVLFLDEFDALAKMRDDEHELGELKRVVISLLQNIDVMSKDHVLIAATNHEHLLDKAIWRRFTYKLHLKEPETTERQKMLRSFLGNFATDDVVEVATMLTKGLTGAEIRHIAEEGLRHALMENRNTVDLQDLLPVVLVNRLDDDSEEPLTLRQQVAAVRSIDPKVFTQSRLASIFKVSQARISRYLKEGGVK